MCWLRCYRHHALLFQLSQILQCQSHSENIFFVLAGAVRVRCQHVALTTLYLSRMANAREFRPTVLTGHQSVAVALDAAPGFFHIADAWSIG